jgi:hypothetical protein
MPLDVDESVTMSGQIVFRYRERGMSFMLSIEIVLLLGPLFSELQFK